MASVQDLRAELLKVQVNRKNKVTKLDAITKFLKKLKTSGPDQKLAACSAEYNLEKFTEEIMQVVKVWVQAQQNQPLCTATLCYCLFQYEQFPNGLVDHLSKLLSTGNTLDQASTKLKLMSLAMQLHYAGKKLPLGQMFTLINVNINNYFIAYYYMRGLVYFFTMYPIKSTDPKRSLRPEDAAAIRKRLMLVKDITVGIFQKEKEVLYRNHKVYAAKMKKGFVLAQELQEEQNKEKELTELKNCIEVYCAQFQFPCIVELKPLGPEKQQPVIQQPTNKTASISLYGLKDFESLLPGILFQQDLSQDFQQVEVLGPNQVDFIKRLSTKSKYQQADDMFQQLMTKFICNQRALILANTIEQPQFLDLFDVQKLVLLARIIASFCHSWKDFTPIINTIIRQRIDSELNTETTEPENSKPFSSDLSKLLFLYAELNNFGVAEENRFMSVFKNLVEIQGNPTAEQIVRSCAKQLLERESTKERTLYLLQKNPLYKDLV